MTSTRTLAAMMILALGTACGVWAGDRVGVVKKVEGEVMVSVDEGEPFAPATVGQELFRGGAVIVMDDAAATLDLVGKGEVALADNAALRLQEVAGTGEYSTVTGVRAPVLFLFPVGQSEPMRPGKVSVTFGINHDLDKVRGLDRFRLYAIHEDAEYDLDEDASVAAFVDASVLLADFPVRRKTAKADYTWYSLRSKAELKETGDYTLYLVAMRGEEPVKLGQSTLLLVEDE